MSPVPILVANLHVCRVIHHKYASGTVYCTHTGNYTVYQNRMSAIHLHYNLLIFRIPQFAPGYLKPSHRTAL